MRRKSEILFKDSWREEERKKSAYGFYGKINPSALPVLYAKRGKCSKSGNLCANLQQHSSRQITREFSYEISRTSFVRRSKPLLRFYFHFLMLILLKKSIFLFIFDPKTSINASEKHKLLETPSQSALEHYVEGMRNNYLSSFILNHHHRNISFHYAVLFDVLRSIQ